MKHITPWPYLSAALLTACSPLPMSTGIVPVGPDTYNIHTRPLTGMEAKTRNLATEEAQAYCRSLEREFAVVSTKEYRILDFYSMLFRCRKEDGTEPRG